MINCEGWACTIVKDFEETKTTKRSSRGGIFEAEKKTRRTRTRTNSRGLGEGMYRSEKPESRGDSPVIFVVGTNVMMLIYDFHDGHEHLPPYLMHIFAFG